MMDLQIGDELLNGCLTLARCFLGMIFEGVGDPLTILVTFYMMAMEMVTYLDNTPLRRRSVLHHVGGNWALENTR